MAKRERDKGARGERELSSWFRDRGYHARRGQQYEGSSDSPDVVVIELPWLHIECKRVEKLNLGKAMAKATSEAAPSQTPAVFHRRNGQPWLVTLPANDFLEILP